MYLKYVLSLGICASSRNSELIYCIYKWTIQIDSTYYFVYTKVFLECQKNAWNIEH